MRESPNITIRSNNDALYGAKYMSWQPPIHEEDSYYVTVI